MLKLFGAGKPDHPMADPKAAKRILEELPGQDLKALEELAHWHESVGAAGFKPELGQQLHVAIDDAAQPRLRKLARDYFAAERPSRFQENLMWTQAHGYLRQAGEAYARCVEGLHAGKGGDAKQLPFLLVRALRTLGQRLKWMHLRYGPIDQSVWGVVNALYATAEARKLADAKVVAYPGAGESTPRLEFVKAAMFSASSPDSLLPAEVELAERLIAEFAPGFTLALAAAPELAYWTDLAQPMAPQRIARPPQPAPGLRLFGGGAALAGLHALIQKIETSGAVPAGVNLGGSYAPEAALDVMQHLAMYWSPVPPERRHPRHNVKTRLTVVHGFDAVRQALGGEGGSLDFDGGAPESWIVENVSAGGFGATVPQIKGDWLRVGTLLGLQPEGGDNWLVGIVRRISKSSPTQARVGIETLSKTPAASQFTIPRVGDESGILLPPGDAGALDTLIALRPEIFVPGVNLEAERGGRQHVYMPQRITERGEDYEIARYREMVREA